MELMFSSKKTRMIRNLVVALIASSTVIFLTMRTPFQSYNSCPSLYKTKTVAVGTKKDELETALEGASMGNRTVIIAILNKAYIEGDKPMLDIFLESFWLGEETQVLVDHLLLVAMDQISFDRCKFLKLHCYRLVTDGVDFGGEKLYMSKDFINMMWRRTLFLADVLQRGYNFIFTDIDVMWLRNPIPRLQLNETVDMQISCDKFGTNQWCKYNLINTGFYSVRSNNKTIALFNKWYTAKNDTNYAGMKEQDVLKSMIQDGGVRELGLSVRFLDTLYFSGFCQDSRRFGLVTTVHANCCRTINAKVVDLTAVLRDWKRLKALIIASRRKSRESANEMRMFAWSEHNACINSWRGFNETIS